MMESILGRSPLESQCRVPIFLSRETNVDLRCCRFDGAADCSLKGVVCRHSVKSDRRLVFAPLAVGRTSLELGNGIFGARRIERNHGRIRRFSESGLSEERVRRNGRKGFAFNAFASSFPSVTKTERTFTLPLDYYQILGAETYFLADSIVRSYEARLAHPPREGFSQEALVARSEILRGARDTLADPDLRGDYNQGLVEDEAGTLMLDVPWSKVSGALCLLQEVGEMEVVLQAGQSLLEERLPKTMQRDVALSMALAYVELSREAMAETVPTVVRSCDLLEAALKLLQEEGGSSLGPELQEHIEETLEELTPRCVLELLSLPLDEEYASQREEGLQGLRSILWAVGEGGAAAPIRGFSREQFIKEAFSNMTSSEQVALWESTPDNVPAESFEVYAVALAHVAEGFAAKKPNFIVKADELFWQLQASVESDGEPGGPLDHSLERAMCWLLMGEVDQSMACLGLQDGGEQYRDPAVIEFVYMHSEGSEEGDLLPGLCKLLETWLGEVVFPTFRNTEVLQVRLGDYYDDPQVINILEQWETTAGGSSSALSRIGAALDSVKTSAIQTFQKVFHRGERTGVKETTTSGIFSPGVEQATDFRPTDYDQYGDYDRSDVSALSGFGSNGTAVHPRSPGWNGSEDSDGHPGAHNLSAQPTGQDSWHLAKLACSGIVFGALVMTGLKVLPWSSASSKVPKTSPPAATTSPISSGMVEQRQAVEFSKMDARLAEAMVRKWQMAKARALGSSHSVSHLSEVLEGKMLESWTDRVNEVARNGWFWEYRLVGLNIDSVTVSDDGRRAIVEATLQEAARLFDDKNPEHKDSYRSTYTTRYEFQHGDKGWRITGGVVLRS
ncbi:hypothetical protein R1flu_027008 [Riccia fluitans]|uniref:ARC6 IMS domain-containing protein n=1 Tax=Riccia fluitans TaxID=41844 RepID=A0ABD1XHJ5_9MARC